MMSPANAFSQLPWRSAASVLGLLIVWEATARAHLAPVLFLPPFSIVAEQLWRSIADGTLASDLIISLGRAFSGLLLGTIAGVILGLLMARNRMIEWLVDPLVGLGFPSPKIAFIPIFILWFGIESLSKILLVAFACIFPVIIGTFNAARSVNRLFMWSAMSLGSRRAQPIPACDFAGVLSAHFYHFSDRCAGRADHHLYCRDGGWWRRHGRNLDLLSAVL